MHPYRHPHRHIRGHPLLQGLLLVQLSNAKCSLVCCGFPFQRRVRYDHVYAKLLLLMRIEPQRHRGKYLNVTPKTRHESGRSILFEQQAVRHYSLRRH